MTTTICTHDERRSSFRIPADDAHNGAGVVIGKSVIPAQLLDYSVTGCLLLMSKQAEVELGDEIRIATFQGQFLAEVRHFKNDLGQSGPLLGLEFISSIENEKGPKSNTHLFSASGKHAVSGNFMTVFGAILVVWAAIAYVSYLLFFQGNT